MLPAAFRCIQEADEQVDSQESDVCLRLQLMVLKARLLSRAGHSPKGFSLALRSASYAQRVGILPALWNAVRELASILITMEEFQTAISLLDSIIPQVRSICERSILYANIVQAHEGGDYATLAALYSLLVDGHVGIQSRRAVEFDSNHSWIWKAVLYLDRAESCKYLPLASRGDADRIEDYRRIGDHGCVAECFAKKAVLSSMRGDATVASSYASKALTASLQQGKVQH